MDIDELLDELIYLSSNKDDYVNRCDYIDWSQEKEDKAIKDYYDCRDKIKGLVK